MLPSWASDTITIVTPVMVTERGKSVPDWSQSPDASTVVEGCSVQPGASAEDIAARQGVTVRFTVLAPPGTFTLPHDAVIFQGVRYAINGAPAAWSSPTGAVSNVAIYIMDWTG